jgi:hypothetical protein
MRVVAAQVATWFVSLLHFYVATVAETLPKFGKEECQALGYSQSLTCNHCGDLDRFGLDILKPSCVRCCTEVDVGASGQKQKVYKYAILEICG